MSYGVNQYLDLQNVKKINSIQHRVQLWAEGLGMPCSALTTGCGITINREQLTGTAKWDDMLKLYEIDKQ
jgi:hypothetical protein